MLINNPDTNDEVHLLTYINGTVSMSQKSKTKTKTSVQMWVDAFLMFSSIYVTARLECATAFLKDIHTVPWGQQGQIIWVGGSMMSSLVLKKNAILPYHLLHSELGLL